MCDLAHTRPIFPREKLCTKSPAVRSREITASVKAETGNESYITMIRTPQSSTPVAVSRG